MSTAKQGGSQFAAFLSQKKKPLEDEAFLEPETQRPGSSEPQISTPTPPSPPSRARPLAKRNNPEYRSWTGFLKKESIIVAGAQLARKKEYPDLSDLLQNLLDEYLKKTQ